MANSNVMNYMAAYGQVSLSYTSASVLNISNTTDATALGTGSLICAGGGSVAKQLQVGGMISHAGTGTPAAIPNCSYQSYDTIVGPLQDNIQNLSNAATASSDVIVTDDTGTNTTNYGDYGVNSSGWGSNPGTFNNAHGVYLYASNYDLAIGTVTAQKIWVVYNSLPHTFFDSTGMSLQVGGLNIKTAGQGLAVAEGANAKQGTVALVLGTATVSNTSVTANSRILLQGQALNASTAIGSVNVISRIAGTSFTITSIIPGGVLTQTGDLRTIAYEIFEPGV